jgi:hypothetical protein
VTKSELVARIADLAEAKVLEGLADVRDESDRWAGGGVAGGRRAGAGGAASARSTPPVSASDALRQVRSSTRGRG